MNIIKQTILLLAISFFISPITACAKEKRSDKPKPKLIQLSKVDTILHQLDKNVASLKTYKVKIEYLFTQDPELFDSITFQKGVLYFKNDEKQSRLRINFETRKEDDEKQQRTHWFRIVAFQRLAEIIAEYCLKGSKIGVRGQLTSREWEDKNGNKQTAIEVRARELELLGNGNGTSTALPAKEQGSELPQDDIPF